jgi:hypothetical protein
VTVSVQTTTCIHPAGVTRGSPSAAPAAYLCTVTAVFQHLGFSTPPVHGQSQVSIHVTNARYLQHCPTPPQRASVNPNLFNPVTTGCCVPYVWRGWARLWLPLPALPARRGSLDTRLCAARRVQTASDISAQPVLSGLSEQLSSSTCKSPCAHYRSCSCHGYSAGALKCWST